MHVHDRFAFHLAVTEKIIGRGPDGCIIIND
jgi:hypothetical protein